MEDEGGEAFKDRILCTESRKSERETMSLGKEWESERKARGEERMSLEEEK